MASPTFLQEIPEKQLQKLSPDDIQQICKAEQLYWNNKPYTAYCAVSHESKTKNGDSIRASIMSFKIKAIAFTVDEAMSVGSRLENGDEIIDTLENVLVFRLYHDQVVPNGFLRRNLKESN